MLLRSHRLWHNTVPAGGAMTRGIRFVEAPGLEPYGDNETRPQAHAENFREFIEQKDCSYFRCFRYLQTPTRGNFSWFAHEPAVTHFLSNKPNRFQQSGDIAAIRCCVNRRRSQLSFFFRFIWIPNTVRGLRRVRTGSLHNAALCSES